MHAAIKRFTQESTDLQIILISILAGAISTKLEVAATLQFLLTAAIILGDIYMIEKIDRKWLSETLNAAGILSLTAFPENLTVFTMLSLILVPQKIYLSAALSHLADVLTTLKALPRSGEANPFLAVLIENLGSINALLISKTALVGLPLLYGYLELGGYERKLFGKTVLVLGLALASRNLFLIF